jgi:uncharacterized membrane protein YeaQ/YmgE (transglycosylase-associated protein family)
MFKFKKENILFYAIIAAVLIGTLLGLLTSLLLSPASQRALLEFLIVFCVGGYLACLLHPAIRGK